MQKKDENLTDSEKINLLLQRVDELSIIVNSFKPEKTLENVKEIIPSLNVSAKQFSNHNEQLELFEEIKIIKNPKRFDKIKNMIANSFVNFTNCYTFRKSYENNQSDWYALAYKAGVQVYNTQKLSKKYLLSILSSFEKIASKHNVQIESSPTKIQKIKNNIEIIKDNFYIIGNKKIIKKLQNNFCNTLNILGFEANDLYHDTHKNNYITSEEVKNNLDNHLNILKFTKLDGKYTNEFLNNLDDEGKATTIKTMLWPTLADKISEGMQLTFMMNEFMKKNKYLLMIDEFATNNNLLPEDVTNILESDPLACEDNHLLAKKIGVIKVKQNYMAIMDNITKFTILTKNNSVAMANLINVTEDIKDIVNNLNITNNEKESIVNIINETIVLDDNSGKLFRYSTIKKNIENLMKSEIDQLKNENTQKKMTVK